MARRALNGAESFVGRHAALVASVASALAVLMLWELRWWHPACASAGESSAWAIGVPLPYAQPTLVSSGEHAFMPHVWLLDVTMLAAILAPVFLAAVRWLGPRTRTVVGVVALLALGALGAFWAFVISALFIPTLSIADPMLDEGWLSYRPAYIAEAFGDPHCH